MKSPRWFVFVLVAVIGFSFSAGDLHAGRPLKAPKPVYVSPSESFGLLPPPVDMKGLRPYAKSLLGQMAPPASWDWRTMNGVTSVKNQNPYGTCWAFATIGDLESKMLIGESVTYDFSELNIVACNPVGTTCNSGGNAWISTNYLTLLGTVYEGCNPYPGGCPNPTCVNPACPYYDRVTEWRLIANDVTAIKNAIMTYGPVYTGMYASFPGFSTYNGSGCLTYTGTESQNHAVLIVGWDDAMCGGNGGWIVKNSWGTAWGAAGYFYIRYGSARVGENVSVLTGYKSYDPDEKIYYYDDWGWWGSVGWGDFDDWALVKFTPTGIPPEGYLLKAVDLWAVWAPTTYTISIYDNFNGTAPSNLLAGPISGTKTEAGYYSIPLPEPLTVYSNNDIYIVVRFNTPSYGYPIPYDNSGPMETNKSYVSSTGVSGTWAALDNGDYGMGDVGIRARVEPRPAPTPTISIFQDTLSFVDRSQTQAYVPFAICNENDSIPSTSYGYRITSKGHIGPPLNTSGSISVPGGECRDVYGILNAGSAITCTYDTLRIVGWTTGGPVLYDTCVQIVHVVEPEPVPLFTPRVVAILVLALIVIAAIFMRRRVRSGK